MTFDHYMGAEEYSILSKQFINYHKYIPYEYIEYGEEAIHPPACAVIQKYYDFFADIESKTGFLKKSMYKSVNCGLWITVDSVENNNIEAYHSYFSYDYGNISDKNIFKFYNTVIGKTEPVLLTDLRNEDIDLGIEGISISPEGEVLKYITLFKPNSNILSYFSDLNDIDKLQKFVDLSFSKLKSGYTNDPESFRSPIRIQFDSSGDQIISIEFACAFFQKEYYLNGNSFDAYNNRKQLYFNQMIESGLLTEEEVEFCKEKSPSWQQFSVKFKWKNNELIDKKLYTFVVVDFEKVL